MIQKNWPFTYDYIRKPSKTSDRTGLCMVQLDHGFQSQRFGGFFMGKGLGWLDVSDQPIEWLLMLEKEHTQWIAAEWKGDDQRERVLGICLKHHPHLLWYFKTLNGSDAQWYQAIADRAPEDLDESQVRQAQIDMMTMINDWMVYMVDPGVYERLSFTQWPESLLTSRVNFDAKRVVDIGAGPGLLTFIAAKTARSVYAVEPVANLRRWIREKAKRLGYRHVFAVDGLITRVPFEDGFADISMAGHVVGDDIEAEYRELRRVTRAGGVIALHPATNDSDEDNQTHRFLIDQGFEWDRFEEPGEGFKRSYWKTVQ